MTGILFAAMLVLAVGCGGDDDSETAACKDGEVLCDGMQVMTCADGEFGPAEDCTGSTECMTMDDGMDMCM